METDWNVDVITGVADGEYQIGLTCWCYAMPYWWPKWVGGNSDFLDQNQPFDKLEELRLSTMMEF